MVRTSLRPDMGQAFPRFKNVLSCVKPKSIYTIFCNDVTHARLCKHWQYVKVFHSSDTFEVKLCLINTGFHRFREGAAHTSDHHIFLHYIAYISSYNSSERQKCRRLRWIPRFICSNKSHYMTCHLLDAFIQRDLHTQYCGQSPQEQFEGKCHRDTMTCWLQWGLNLRSPDPNTNALAHCATASLFFHM